MKFADEFRDPAAARALVKSITELAGDGEHKFMEVCGGHTHTIYRHALEHLLPPSIELVHGPGRPVCVIPMGRVDDAIWLAGKPDVIFTTFGAMMRVPGSDGSLLEARARGCDVRFVYSPLDALKIAVDNPAKQVVCSRSTCCWRRSSSCERTSSGAASGSSARARSVFGTACTPETPIGTCMVSPEGACAAYCNFGRLHRETAALVGQQRTAAHG